MYYYEFTMSYLLILGTFTHSFLNRAFMLVWQKLWLQQLEMLWCTSLHLPLEERLNQLLLQSDAFKVARTSLWFCLFVIDIFVSVIFCDSRFIVLLFHTIALEVKSLVQLNNFQSTCIWSSFNNNGASTSF